MQDFRIETFLSVCQTMNYTESSRLLHITQPAVSQQIRFLENAYGTKLFDYRGKKLSLTEQGVMLRDASQTIRADEDVLKRKMATAVGMKEKLNLGLTMTVGQYVVPDSLARYVHAHPELELNIQVGDTRKLLERLRDGRIDCAIVEGYFDKAEFGWRVLREEPFVGICAVDHKLPKAGKLSFDDLLVEHLITREAGSGTRAVLEHALAAQNLTVDDFSAITESNSIALIKHLVYSDCGIAFLYLAAVRDELDKGTLRQITLTERRMSHAMGAVWRRDSVFSDFYENVIADLMD